MAYAPQQILQNIHVNVKRTISGVHIFINARKILNDDTCDDIYLMNNAIIDSIKYCFDKIVEINKFNPTNRRYFDLKTNWQLIRECQLETVVENISNWLQAQDPRYDGKFWIDNPREISTDETAEYYEKGWIISKPSN